MCEKINILDKSFQIYIHHEKILKITEDVANKINKDLSKKNVIFLGVLNGAFMFASELLKRISFNCEVSFVKVASYSGKSTTGTVKRLIGINEDLKNKTVVIIEDIVDTGITTENIIKQLKGYEAKEIKIATLFFKPDSFTKNYKIDYSGMEIQNNFIVGFGLDYKGIGRNLKHIYKLIE